MFQEEGVLSLSEFSIILGQCVLQLVMMHHAKSGVSTLDTDEGGQKHALPRDKTKGV